MQAIRLINPNSGRDLTEIGNEISDDLGNKFSKVNGVYRFVDGGNYTDSFGFQWNKFEKTQIDSDAHVTQSQDRFFAETGWVPDQLCGCNILEVGSGAGRFSQVVLKNTSATLYSVDYSLAVEANFRNNGHYGERLKLFQASIYELPFAHGSFDKVFCFGVLQHTPNFDASVKALITQAKPGGEVVVDFYPIKGWWSKIHAKYLLRPFTKQMTHKRLLRLIEANVDWLMTSHLLLHRLGFGILTRFLPLCNFSASFSKTLSKGELREWTILDTFDQYSPEHDHPQRISAVVNMFNRHGATVTFAGYKCYGDGMFAAVVRGVRNLQ